MVSEDVIGPSAAVGNMRTDTDFSPMLIGTAGYLESACLAGSVCSFLRGFFGGGGLMET